MLRAIHAYLHPATGGPDGTGWPLGRPVHARELVGVLAAVPGVDLGRDANVHLRRFDLVTRDPGERLDRVDLGPDELPVSWDPQVRVRS